jgi:hypothetical protein
MLCVRAVQTPMVQTLLRLGSEGSFDSEYYRTSIKAAVRHGFEQVGKKDDRQSRIMGNRLLYADTEM